MKRLFILILAVIPLMVGAQSIQFGYLSYDTVLHQMPEYIKVQNDLMALRSKYEAEANRGEEEFQKKFVEFMQGQKDFPQTILQKRQGELQTLMDNGVNFRIQAQELIKKAEKDMMTEVKKILQNAILAVGVEQGFGLIMNTDNDNCPFISPVIGVDVTDLVRLKLGIIQALPQQVIPAAPVQPTQIAPIQVAPVQVTIPEQPASTTGTNDSPQEH